MFGDFKSCFIKLEMRCQVLFLRSQVQTHRGGLPKTVEKQCFDLFGPTYTERSFLRSSKNHVLFLRVQTHDAALETTEITVFSFGGLEEGGRDGGDEEEDSAGLTKFAACQGYVFCVATRPAACQHNTNQQKMSTQTVRFFYIIDAQR